MIVLAQQREIVSIVSMLHFPFVLCVRMHRQTGRHAHAEPCRKCSPDRSKREAGKVANVWVYLSLTPTVASTNNIGRGLGCFSFSLLIPSSTSTFMESAWTAGQAIKAAWKLDGQFSKVRYFQRAQGRPYPLPNFAMTHIVCLFKTT